MNEWFLLLLVVFLCALVDCHGSHMEDAACIETYGVECNEVTPKMEGLFRKEHNLIGE